MVTANAQEREVGRFRQRNDRFIEALMAMQRTTYLSGGLPGVVLSGSTALVFLYGGQRVIDGTLTLGTLVAFMAYQLRLFGPIQALMGLYTSLATVRVSLGRVHEILDVAPEVVEAATPVSLSTPRGELTLDDVSFSFERGAPVLEHVSLRVAPGECLAIVGPSGSGKSTIADLVLRLLDPQAGTVTLDGHDLRTLKLADLRACVALVDQEPAVFHASIADNIRYARPSATATDVEAAARSAGLDAFVATLPDGYDTTVGERGAARSRQASDNGSRWRARCWSTRRCWCSTRRRRRSTRGPSSGWSRATRRSWRGAPPFSSRTGRRLPAGPTGWWSSMVHGSSKRGRRPS